MVILEPIYHTLAERIKAARKNSGMTQQELADAVGLTRVSIANIESGRQRLMFHHAGFIAGLLGVDLNIEPANMAKALAGIKQNQAKKVKESIKKRRQKIQDELARIKELEAKIHV